MQEAGEKVHRPARVAQAEADDDRRLPLDIAGAAPGKMTEELGAKIVISP